MGGQGIDEFNDYDDLENPLANVSFPPLPKPVRRVRTLTHREHLGFLDDKRTKAVLEEVAQKTSPKNQGALNGLRRVKRGEVVSVVEVGRHFGKTPPNALRLCENSGLKPEKVVFANGRSGYAITHKEFAKLEKKYPHLIEAKRQRVEKKIAASKGGSNGTSKVDAQLDPNVPNGLALTRSVPRQIKIPSNAKFAGL